MRKLKVILGAALVIAPVLAALTLGTAHAESPEHDLREGELTPYPDDGTGGPATDLAM